MTSANNLATYGRWIADLQRPELWKVERNVPVFYAHERLLEARSWRDGTTEPALFVKFLPGELPAMAARSNAGGLQPMTLGHNPHDPEPGSEPAPLVGWQLNLRCDDISTDRGRSWKPGIRADLFYRACLYDGFGPHKFPCRSVDCDPYSKTITALALLDGVRIAPYLDLGALPYCQMTRPAFPNGA